MEISDCNDTIQKKNSIINIMISPNITASYLKISNTEVNSYSQLW